MRKLRVYLDTSVINFLFADDAPDFKRVTELFFKEYAARYALFASRVVVAEIEQSPNREHRERLLSVLSTYPIAMLSANRATAVERLARSYITAGVIPTSKPADAMHVAYATVFRMDILLSWNFKHLA